MSSNRRIYGPGGSYALMYVTPSPRIPNGVYKSGSECAPTDVASFVMIGQAWMPRARSGQGASMSTARMICVDSPRTSSR